ncbi:hypothetical protein ThvES_00005150 [Thiovulum sp. ES]|nr:hypothetical protein ThvES_00005150 [Thiovulum sp. ES]
MFNNFKNHLAIFLLIFGGCQATKKPVSPQKSEKTCQCPENNVSNDYNKTETKIIKKLKL